MRRRGRRRSRGCVRRGVIGGGPQCGGGDRSGGGTYTVRSGDTLSSIAQELGTTVEALVEANDIADPDVIDIGQQLTVPSG